MMVTRELLQSVADIKGELLRNIEADRPEMVTRDRGTGKSLAVLEFVHEYCCGMCIVVTCTPVAADLLTKTYRSSFPDDELPAFRSFHSLRAAHVQGAPRCWVTDEIWPWAVEDRIQEFKALTFLGGVCTPYCATMHSER